MRLVIRELRQTYWRADFHLAAGLVSNCIMTNAETLYYPISCGEKMWPCKILFRFSMWDEGTPHTTGQR